MSAKPRPPATHLSASIAELVTSREFTEVSDQQHSHVSDVLLDTIAVCAHAATRPEILATSAAICGQGDGPATMLGSRERGPVVAAAISNGIAANATLLAEGHRAAGGHPAAHIVPALLACCEMNQTQGRLLLRALTAGYETAVRARELVAASRPGLSPNGNWGTIGAAAAVAYAATGGDKTAIAHAIDAAAAVAIQGPMAFGHEGADSYRLFVGLGAGSAVAAGLGAAAGWDASPGTLTEWFAGIPPTAAVSLRDFGGSVAISENYFKWYGTCAHTQAAIDAISSLRCEYELDSEKNELAATEVRCGVPSAAELPVDPPRNTFAARYNIPLMTAVTWWHGPDALMLLDDDIWRQPRVRHTAANTSVEYDENLARRCESGRPTKVTLRFRDGRSIERIVLVPRGDAQNPFSRSKLRRKARALLELAHGSPWADGVIAAVENLQALGTPGLTASFRECKSARTTVGGSSIERTAAS